MRKPSNKLTTEQVNQIVKSRGYWIDPDFVWLGATQPVKFICPEHGKIQMSLSNLRRSHCKKCSVASEKKRRTANSNVRERLTQLLQERGFEAIDPLDGVLAFTRIRLRCTRDLYEWTTCFNWLSQHPHGCTRCSGLEPLRFEDLKSKLQLKGVEVLSSEPTGFNQTTPFQVRCAKGHTYETNGNKVQNGGGCRFCAGVALWPDQVQQKLAELDFESITPYLSAGAPLEVRCSQGHTFTKSYRSLWWDRTRCPKCHPPFSSSDENELADWLKTLLPENDIERNDHTILNGHEIDILIPKRSLGIEFNGLYYHNETALIASGKTRKEAQGYHQSKFVRAAKKSIQLITLWDFEWYQRRTAVQSRLKALLGLNSIRIGARQCDLRKIVSLEQREAVKLFLDRYHIQGRTSFQHAYGLYQDGELLAVMTFRRHHRQNVSEDVWVLNRFCVISDHTISGGASRLFRAAMKELRRPCLSYSDNRWSTGGIYRQLGFTKIHASRPDYFYTRAGKPEPISKQSQKKRGAEKTSGETERTLRARQGLHRVWDCGKLTWRFDPTIGKETGGTESPPSI